MGAPEDQGNDAGISYSSVVVVLFALALWLRLWGIGTESFNRDEVLSARFSQGGVAEIVARNAADVHPPLYHLGLYCWRQVWGDADDRIRGYSLVWSMAGLLGVFLLARDAGSRRIGLVALLLAAVNPLDVYFAQEARMYSQATALVVFASWCLWRWTSAVAEGGSMGMWWRWAAGYAVCAVAALYTHYLTVMVLVAQGVFALAWFAMRKHAASVLGYVVVTLVAINLFLPWYSYVLGFRYSLYHHALNWIRLPPVSDYYSFLGREAFWGQAVGMQARLWGLTMALAGVVLLICAWRPWRDRTGAGEAAAPRRHAVIFFFCLLFGPVILAAIASREYHPIYYRPKFAIFVLSPFLILAAIACHSFRWRGMPWMGGAVLATIMLHGTVVQHHTYQNLRWREFPGAWREHGAPSLAVFFPLFLEIAPNRYMEKPIVSPARSTVERLLPDLEGGKIWICFPFGHDFYNREDDYTYYQWLVCQGAVRQVPVGLRLVVQEVSIGAPPAPDTSKGELDRWFAPFDIARKIEGFCAQNGFHPLEFDPTASSVHCWSGPRARFCLSDGDHVSTVVMNVQFPRPAPPGYRPALCLYAKRGSEHAALFDETPIASIDDYRADAFTITMAAPPGPGPLWIGWRMNAVHLAATGYSGDARDLGLRLNWVGAIKAAGSPPEKGRRSNGTNTQKGGKRS